MSCSNNKQASNLYSYIPQNSDLVIQINSLESLESSLKNNSFITAMEDFKNITSIKTQLKPFLSAVTNKSLIALSKASSSKLELSLILPLPNAKSYLRTIENLTITPFDGDNRIYKIQNDQDTFYSFTTNDMVFISNTLDITKTALTQPMTKEHIALLYNTSSTDKMASILFRHKPNTQDTSVLSNPFITSKQFSKTTMLDLDISQHKILATGITKAEDSTHSFINIFKNTLPQENKIAHVLPPSITQFTSFTFNDYERFRKNLIAHQLSNSDVNTITNYQNIVELGQARTNTQDVIVARSIDPSHTLNNIEHTGIIDTHRNTPIYGLDTTPSFLIDCRTILNSESKKYVTLINEFLLFSNDIDFLKSIITTNKNKTTLENTTSYRYNKLDLSDDSSLLIYGNTKNLNEFINVNFDENLDLDTTAYKTFAIQYVYERNFAHVAAVLKPTKTEKKQNTVSEEFNTTLNTKLLTTPQFVTNYKTNQKDIIVQDINNYVYLVSNTGNVFWKKQLDGELLGEVHQIDTYKNGRLQFVFNTSNRLYILDRNGKDVNQFPLKFSDKITQPVSVFDYDNNKNYRILITQGASLLMYDENGKRISGFKYKPQSKNISSQPKHFRIENKDYIVFTRGNTVEILNRKGQQRIALKEGLNLSKNEIYLYNNQFTTTTTNGELLQINTKGKITSKRLNLNSTHNLTTTSKTLVSLDDNKLTIRSKTIELDFGDYTEPKIFYINNKIYVAVTDLQSKKAYLFDSQARPIANFPVYANSSIDLDNIDKDRALEVVTTGDEDSILVYEIH